MKFRHMERTSYPVTVIAVPGAELMLIIYYDRRCFEGATISRMMGHFRTLLEGIVAHPEQQLSELPLLTAAERQQLVCEWNQTKTDYPGEQVHPSAVRSAGGAHPGRRGGELWRGAGELRRVEPARESARALPASAGVGPEVLVGLSMERSVEMVVGLLGIFKAGGAYVPLEPAYPKERLAFMLEDTGLAVLLTQQRLVATLPRTKRRCSCLDTDWAVIGQQSARPAGQPRDGRPTWRM